VVSSLEKVQAFVDNAVNEPVFLCDPSGPASGKRVSEGFGLSESCEGIAHHRLDQIQQPDGNIAVGLHPIAKILMELRLKDCEPLNFLCHPTWLSQDFAS